MEETRTQAADHLKPSTDLQAFLLSSPTLQSRTQCVPDSRVDSESIHFSLGALSVFLLPREPQREGGHTEHTLRM